MGDSRIGSIGSSMVTQSSSIDILKRQEEAAEVMFVDMISMNGTVDADNITADVADEMLSTVETDKLDTRRENPTDAYEKYQYKDKTIRTETSDSGTVKTEEAVAEVEEFEEAVTEVIAEELHVSKEELEAAMEDLGLTYLDLLDNSNLANLVAKLTGGENINQLLCNEAFTNVLQQVNTLGAELANELQMTPAELMEFQQTLEQLPSLETTEATPQEMPISDAETDTNTVVTEHATEVVDEVTDELNVVQTEKTEMAVETETVEETTEEGVKIEVVRTDEQMDTSEESMSEGEEQNFTKSDEKQLTGVRTPQGNEHVVLNETQTTTFVEQLGEFETVQTLPPHVTVSDIMEQFAEQTRVMISADTTRMEMQLNPEHLGKLYLEIVESEGAITAKIQTQNEVVREALEMQIADLKVNLNQAGVKVDSVEVTVASHEFERNLEQDANSQKQQEDAQPKTARLRNINLNGLDELSGLMTEEETLVAKMMAEQGNSVDFTA